MNTDYNTDDFDHLVEITDASAFLNRQDVTISLRDFDAVKKLDALLLQACPDISVRLVAVIFHCGEDNIVQYVFKQRAPDNDAIFQSCRYHFKPELVQEDL